MPTLLGSVVLIVLRVKSCFLFLCHQVDESEKCHLEIIDFHVKNKCVFDVMWYGPFISAPELYRPEFIKLAIKGQLAVFRFEINNVHKIILYLISWCGLQRGKPIVCIACWFRGLELDYWLLMVTNGFVVEGC